jgi:hypothetical protein
MVLRAMGFHRLVVMPVTQSVLRVLRLRSVPEVRDRIIGGVAVQMTDLKAGRSRSEECSGNQGVH